MVNLEQSSFFINGTPEEVVHNLDLTGKEFRQQLEETLKTIPGNIVITGHSGTILPDGDDICSVLALQRILKKQHPDKHIPVVLSELPIHSWDNFFATGDITWAQSEEKDGRRGDVADHVTPQDALVCLDQGQLSHFSRFPDRLQDVPTIILDHHAVTTDLRASVRLREPQAVATCELIARMYPLNELDEQTCELLYLGMSSDTGGFTYRDYGDTKRLANALLEKSGKTHEKIMAKLQPEPQIDAYQEAFSSHATLFAPENQPAIAYQFLTPQEMQPTAPTENPNYCLQTALRRSFGSLQKQFEASAVQFIFVPANTATDGTVAVSADTYKVEFRRSKGQTVNLKDVAQTLGGGGHESASGATFTLTPEQVQYIEEQNNDPDFNKMEYVATVISEKIRAQSKKIDISSLHQYNI